MLERLTARLCDRTLPTRDPPTRLERLSRRDRLPHPPRPGPPTVSIRRFARCSAELHRAEPETPKLLAARAAEWCAGREMESGGAVRLDGGRPDRYAELTERRRPASTTRRPRRPSSACSPAGRAARPTTPGARRLGRVVHALRGTGRACAGRPGRVGEAGAGPRHGTPLRPGGPLLRSALCQADGGDAMDAAAAAEALGTKPLPAEGAPAPRRRPPPGGRGAAPRETLAEASAAAICGHDGHRVPGACRAALSPRSTATGTTSSSCDEARNGDPGGGPRRLPDERAHLRDERPMLRCTRATGCGRARMPDTPRVPCRC